MFDLPDGDGELFMKLEANPGDFGIMFGDFGAFLRLGDFGEDLEKEGVKGAVSEVGSVGGENPAGRVIVADNLLILEAAKFVTLREVSILVKLSFGFY